ncbi:MAG: hypothetical protein IMZ58_11865 [Thermoplasmata archaeon]|nr:hypothetical protein [Thermoplasmata archaeon]
MLCYNFVPHLHRDRLTKIPNAETIFVCGNGDIAFCETNYIDEIVASTYLRKKSIFYWQSKSPKALRDVCGLLRHYNTEESNHIMLTTLETNRDKDYHLISKAPVPTDRSYDFMRLPWPRKIVTIEPIMDFDHDEFLKMILDIKPEAVYVGYNSMPGAVKLPEPSHDKAFSLITCLKENGIKVKTKYLPWEEMIPV